MNINSFSLNLEQEFQMKLVGDSVLKMDREQMSGLLIDLVRIGMIKDNAIRDLLKNDILPYSKI